MPLILQTMRPGLYRIALQSCRPFSSTLESIAIADGNQTCYENGLAAHNEVNVPSFIGPLGSRIHEIYKETKKLADHISNSSHLPAILKAAQTDIIERKTVETSLMKRHVDLTDDSCGRDVHVHSEEWFLAYMNHLRLLTSYDEPSPAKSRENSVSTGIRGSSISMKRLKSTSGGNDDKANCDSTITNQSHFYDDYMISRTRYELEYLLRGSGGDDGVHLSTEDRSMLSFLSQTSGAADDVCQFSVMQKQEQSSKTPVERPRKPNIDQLRAMQDHLTDYMPRFFTSKHDYRIYTENVVFENNIAKNPYTTSGVAAYVRELATLRTLAVMKFANVRMFVLRSGVDEERGVVTVRWRISGIPQLKAFMFWKFLPWKFFMKKTRENSIKDESEWVDGLSTFHINNEGLITKHTADKMVPDDEVSSAKENPALKLAKKMGLAPSEGVASAPVS